MNRRSFDPSIRGILITAASLLAVIGCLLAINLSGFTTEKEIKKVTIADLDEQSMILYANVQQKTGIPWILLYSVDKTEEVVPDLAHTESVAETLIQKGAIRKGLVDDPLKNAAELAGLYTNNRKSIAKIAKHVLELQDVYAMIRQGKYPADGEITNETAGCRIAGCTHAYCPFAGRVSALGKAQWILFATTALSFTWKALQAQPYKSAIKYRRAARLVKPIRS